MRALALVLIVVLAYAPPVSANEPPIALADVQASAVLGEPVTFTSASFDPDGTIASTRWEDSDGRERSGTSVTLVFHFAGVHTITLRVTDNAGATTTLAVPILVHAPIMHGRALALAAAGSTHADTGDVVTTQHSDQAESVGDANHGALRVAGLDATLRTLENRAVARADVGWVYIPLPIGYVLLTGIEAESIVGCGYPTIVNAKFTQLRLNDAPLVPPGDVPPNTRVALPGGALLELNVQESDGDRLRVVAARFTSLDGSVAEIARAEAGVTHCPWT